MSTSVAPGPVGYGPGFWTYDAHGSVWRNDWVRSSYGGWKLSGEGDDPHQTPTGSYADPYFAHGAPGADSGGVSNAGAVNPSASDHGAAQFHSAGGGMKLPGGPQVDTGA